MSDIVKDAIAAEIALIEPIVAHASAPFGYGSDISCAHDVDEGVRELDGFDPLVLAQAIARRLDCPRGALPDDPDYGISLRERVNVETTAADIRAMGGQIRGEVLKDDRVSALVVKVNPTPTGSSIGIVLEVTPFDARTGSFTLTLSASDAGVLIQAIDAKA